MTLAIYIVNAFTNGDFTGNPAAVCPLEYWLEEPILQAIAAQNNLSETVFFVKEKEHYTIRWFTPTIEVPLCGHATLAAAHVLFNELAIEQNEIQFHCKSGLLRVKKNETNLILNFPSEIAEEISIEKTTLLALGIKPLYIGKGRVFIMIEVASEADVASANPDLYLLKKLDAAGVIITAKSDTVDFVSRVFAPQSGINEDPVTGSAHCLLIPYWAQKLKKDNLIAKQLSKRGGTLYCTYAGERVFIGGQTELYLKGEIIVNS